MNSLSMIGLLLKAAAAVALGLLAAQTANAGISANWTRSSTVTDSVTNNNGSWTYRYTVNNTSLQSDTGKDREPILVDWELPWFGDAGITNIVSPRNWDHKVETIGISNSTTGWGGVAAWQTPGDPFYAGSGSPFTSATRVLHWYNTCWAAPATTPTGDFRDAAVPSCDSEFDNAIFPDRSLAGFGFDAAFDPTAAPYQASWAFLPIRTGDPAFPDLRLDGFPNSPLAQGIQAIPEPGMLGLLGVSLVALTLTRRRRA